MIAKHLCGRILLVVTTTVVVLPVGCESAPPQAAEGSAEHTVRDSAGIAIHLTSPVIARGPMAWSVSATPVLEIGGRSTGVGEYVFHRIRGVARLPGRSIVVVDGSSRQLRLFSPEGHFMRAVGREGRGPGEFRSMPTLVKGTAYDSILVFDAGLQRFSVFDTAVALLAAYRPVAASATPFVVPWGTVTVTRITHPLGILGDRVLTLHSVGLFGGGAGVVSEPHEFRLVHPSSGDELRLGLFEDKSWFSTALDELGQSARLQTPFVISPAATVGLQSVLLIPPGGLEIREYDDQGRFYRALRLNEQPRAVTRQDLPDFVQELASTAPSAAVADMYRREYQKIAIPQTMPTFDAVVFDELGYVWARLFDYSEQALDNWVLFGPDGHGLGTVALPSGLQIHQVGVDFILGTWRSEYGIESVRVYSLARIAEGAT